MRPGVLPRVGDRVEPLPELHIQIVEVAERAAQEEVFANIAERALYLSLYLCPVWRTSLRQKSVMRRQVEQLAIVSDALIVDFGQHRRLHAIVEDLRRYSAERFKGRNMAAQNSLQVLMRDEAAPNGSAINQANYKAHDGR